MADPRYVIDEPDAAKARYGVQGNAICKRLINFDTGSFRLLDPHKQGLSEILAQMRPEGDVIYIIGHASKRGGAHFDNKGLSENRAKAVYDWFHYYMDTSHNALHVAGEGDTVTLGTTDPNDPRDRAVVIIAQAGTAPIPKVLPDPPPYQPNQPPDGPLPTPTLPLLRQTGWKFEGQGSLTVTAQLEEKGPLGVGATLGVMTISLKRLSTGEISRYSMFGTGIAFSAGKNALEKLPGVGQALKRFGLNWGPESLPNPGTEIVATPLMGEPITAKSFAGPAFVLSTGVTIGPGQPAASLLLFSKIPIAPAPLPVDPGLATITAMCSFAGPSLTSSIGFSGNIDRFAGNLRLQT